jgi:hypothetical protein
VVLARIDFPTFRRRKNVDVRVVVTTGDLATLERAGF